MKITMIGKRDVSYTKKETGELKEGVELFYYAPSDGVDGNACDTIWIDSKSRFYAQVKGLTFASPIVANIVNEVAPGRRFPQITEFTVLSK